MKKIMRKLRRMLGRPVRIRYHVPHFQYEERHPGWTFEDKWHEGTSPSAPLERAS